MNHCIWQRRARALEHAVTFLFALGLQACAGGPPAAAKSPGTTLASAPVAAEPAGAATPAPEPAEPAVQVPPAPAACERYQEQSGDSGGAPSEPACQSAVAFREALAAALSATAGERDLALARLAVCSRPLPGWVAALRAELVEVECADVVARPALAATRELRIDVRDALRGFTLAAQLSRLVREPPRVSAPTKEEFERYFKEHLTPWILAQAHSVQLLSQSASRLEGYGRAVAAVEAGIADMRFVEVVRDVPLPTSMAKDASVSEAYYAALDQALEPRKARGRDAALVGLAEFAKLGILASSRVDRARHLLATLYGGRRIDALDGLLLPPLAAYRPGTTEERLAAVLPAFFAGSLLDDVDPTQPGMLRALLGQGIDERSRRLLDAGAISQQSAVLYARALIRLGQLYWRSADFASAARLASLSPLAGQPQSDETRLLAAIGQVLQQGPKDARQMMLEGPRYPEGLGNVEALERLTQGRTGLAGYAAFDAAHISSLVPPLGGGADITAFWRKLAARFEYAAPRLPQRSERVHALTRAAAAKELAAAVERAKAPASAPR